MLKTIQIPMEDLKDLLSDYILTYENDFPDELSIEFEYDGLFVSYNIEVPDDE